MPKKKYGLHCFNCGSLFYNKEDVCRVKGLPYCGECEGNYYQDIAERDIYEYEEKKWIEENPGVDREQYEIDQTNIHKYGEC